MRREAEPIWILTLAGLLVLGGSSILPAIQPGAIAGPAEEEGTALLMDSSAVVEAAINPTAVKVQAGDTLRFRIDVTIAPEWHLYAHADTTFYGIDLELPEEHSLRDIIAGTQTISFQAVLPADAAGGKQEMVLHLVAQACDHKRCLAPAWLPLNLILEVE